MTDEELEKVARSIVDGTRTFEDPSDHFSLHDSHAQPQAEAVIVLLERVRRAEARVKELETVPQCENGCDREAFREAHPYCGGRKSIYENDD